MDEEEERDLINELEALNLRTAEIIEQLAARDVGKQNRRGATKTHHEVRAVPVTSVSATGNPTNPSVNGLRKGTASDQEQGYQTRDLARREALD
ncbi:hypothetical protein MHU86_1758 [Fragilaria crotonensis]|nr:hypothetical protein MHU86_1758 [Fragilaria crotonensis]